MLHISLFSGIGGFDLPAEWAGWTNIVSCEINPFGRKHLEYYWPNAYHHDDIHTLTYDKINQELTKRFGPDWRADDIVLSGGFPCQPYSLAGKRKGKEDDRHLWPQMLRAIREIQPTWVVGENVLGIANWDGGLVFEEVQADLKAEGYKVQPYVLPACAANAPHRRDRVWFVAYSNGCRINRAKKHENSSEDSGNRQQSDNTNYNGKVWRPTPDTGCKSTRIENQPEWTPSDITRCCSDENQRSENHCTQNGPTPDTTSQGRKERQQDNGWQNTEENRTGMDNRPERFSSIRPTPDTDQFNGDLSGLRAGKISQQQTSGILKDIITDTDSGRQPSEEHGQAQSGRLTETSLRDDWQNFPTQSPVCGGDDGLPTELDGITFSKWRNESIKAYGNAVVPQVVYQIFSAINQYTASLNHENE